MPTKARSTLLLRIATAVLAVTISSTAVAQEDVAARAQALIDEGVALRRGGDDAGALARFEESFALVRTAHARAQIALVEQALGHWIDAEAHLLEALGSHEAWVEERRATLEPQLDVIRSHLGRVELVGGVRGALVTIDDRPVGELPISSALWVEPGPVTIEVRADGYLPFSTTVTTTAGEQATAQIEMVAVSPAPDQVVSAPPAVPTSHGSRFPFDILGWSAVGAGAAALVVGFISLAVRNDEATTFNSDVCLAGGLTRGENCRSHYDTALSWESASIGTFVIGGILAAGGVALVLINWTTGGESESSSSLACTPSVGATWGVTCGGRL